MKSKVDLAELGESIKLTGFVNLGIGEAILDSQSIDSNKDSNSSSDYMSHSFNGRSPNPIFRQRVQ